MQQITLPLWAPFAALGVSALAHAVVYFAKPNTIAYKVANQFLAWGPNAFHSLGIDLPNVPALKPGQSGPTPVK